MESRRSGLHEPMSRKLPFPLGVLLPGRPAIDACYGPQSGSRLEMGADRQPFIPAPTGSTFVNPHRPTAPPLPAAPAVIWRTLP